MSDFDVIGRLHDMFNRRRSPWGSRDYAEQAELLRAPLERGRLRAKLTRIPRHVCLSASDGNFPPSRAEGAPHQYMKRTALHWMLEAGATDAMTECPIYDWRADVFSDELNWIIECGHTAIRKLVLAVDDPSAPRFTLIPFQGDYAHLDTRSAPPRGLWAVDFEWDADLGPEIRRQRMDAMKGLLDGPRPSAPLSGLAMLAGER